MTKLRVGAVSRNYFNMPLWAAQHRGFFAREGLEVELHLIEGIDEVTRRLAAGELDIDLGVTENVILERERGGRLAIVAGNVNRLPFSLIARAGIGSIPELRGARIGVSSIQAGSSSLVMELLARHGLRYPDDYTLLPVGPILARWRMLQSGEIDAGLQGAPMNRIAIEQGYSDLGSPRALFPDFQFTSVNVDMAWASAHRETVVAFLRAYIEAHRWLRANKEASRAIAAAEADLSAEHADFAWDEMVEAEIFPPDARASVAAVQALIDVSALIRALPGRAKLSAESYIDPRFVDEAERSLA
ncbi:ABC transporter substrate-binding protein [Enterovirga rhinocerotis]|uniref:ABC-type nitrate/sulfonate/bicarbonate transport system substrate-binding protein n=1 Tax=Enterovirga rhinocerotis TaxID=1339210 RepID=A0A4R7C016_9HYPH|nr:ABC transporter substrate-binding protein [Enterovirga rhinocerotis]TDR90385.1 ABC-type nitrate/sulfonate/bicarbonate transport system substrate-binding protein [Enterovirga rhinocerotis]